MHTTTSLDPMALDIFSRLPASLRRELTRGADRAVRHAIEHVGAPNLTDRDAVLIFGTGGARESLFVAELRRYAGARATGPATPMSANRQGDWDNLRNSFPAPASRAMMGPNGNPQDNGGAKNVRQVRRHPYSFFGQTTLAAGSGITTNANNATYTNGTGYDFICTHVTLSQGVEPLIFNPSYRLQISPQYGVPWTTGNTRTDAGSLLSNMGPYQVPTATGFASARWLMEGCSYMLRNNQSIYTEATNPNASEQITVSLLLYGTVQNPLGSPRLFADTLTLAAGAAATPFNSSRYQNAGDFEVEIREAHITSGTGNWGTSNVTSPLIMIRPNEDREFNAYPTMATNLNTTPGVCGPYLRLQQPQRIPAATTVNTLFENTTGSEVIANMGLVGYLEIPVN